MNKETNPREHPETLILSPVGPMPGRNLQDCLIINWWCFGRTDVEAKTPILWPPDRES